jgi:hypothetical protein
LIEIFPPHPLFANVHYWTASFVLLGLCFPVVASLPIPLGWLSPRPLPNDPAPTPYFPFLSAWIVRAALIGVPWPYSLAIATKKMILGASDSSWKVARVTHLYVSVEHSVLAPCVHYLAPIFPICQF